MGSLVIFLQIHSKKFSYSLEENFSISIYKTIFAQFIHKGEERPPPAQEKALSKFRHFCLTFLSVS